MTSNRFTIDLKRRYYKIRDRSKLILSKIDHYI